MVSGVKEKARGIVEELTACGSLIIFGGRGMDNNTTPSEAGRNMSRRVLRDTIVSQQQH